MSTEAGSTDPNFWTLSSTSVSNLICLAEIPKHKAETKELMSRDMIWRAKSSSFDERSRRARCKGRIVEGATLILIDQGVGFERLNFASLNVSLFSRILNLGCHFKETIILITLASKLASSVAHVLLIYRFSGCLLTRWIWRLFNNIKLCRALWSAECIKIWVRLFAISCSPKISTLLSKAVMVCELTSQVSALSW